ncbi:2-amino-4-hydroxy-6-hydroxymethyldihydropteridine diphosphokinase [Sphingomonas sp. 1P08PE]|uniref:2-amino-4-hydroxy-6- hydroxymethyldihydropteridine diphosphokinase n=1 Tax=Sphingomonas sp. 1P08PE TaxID=554122 RepID=UPI0039A36FD8
MAGLYAVALGSNRRTRHGSPAATVSAAMAAIGGVVARSPIAATPPLGPSIRRFANAAVLIRSDDPPPLLLDRLKAIERAMGRRPGRRWGARPIDLDIVMWSGGRWRSRTLTVPHAACRTRRFVLAPLAAIVPGWRDPLTGRTVRQLLSQVDRRRPST